MAAKMIMDLPVEMLVEIFSFLDIKELPNLFVVCSKFNAAAKDPSLWQKSELTIYGRDDSRKISSFCNFFSQFQLIRVMSITGDHFYSPKAKPLDNKSVNNFNQLFENCKHLSCLVTDMNLKNIVLPPSLRHIFACKLSNEVCEADKLPFLDNCPKIKRLHLAPFLNARGNAVSSVLVKYQCTLSALYLKIFDFKKEWIPLIANCLNLKELGLDCIFHWEEIRSRTGARMRRPVIPNLSPLFKTSLSSRLEILCVNNIHTYRSFDNNIVFPELKVLTIETCENAMDLLPVIKRMPKLHTLHFFTPVSKPISGSFCGVVNSCKTLRYLLIRSKGFDFNRKAEFDKIIPELNKGVSEENQWRFSEEYISDNFRWSPLNCSCWKSNKVLIDFSKHKQLHVMDEMDEERSESSD